MIKERIPAIFRLKNIYYIFPLWMVTVICLIRDIRFNDLGHYLRMGEVMIQTRSLLSQDIFTHTFPGLQYINSGWLSQVILAWCVKIAGLHGLILIKIVILIIAMLLCFLLFQRLAADYVITILFISYAAVLGFTNWEIRPQTFAIPLFICLFSYLYVRKEITFFAIALFASLTALWANLHSSYPLALLLVGIFGMGELMDGLLSARNSSAPIRDKFKDIAGKPRMKALLLLAAVLTISTLANPYGLNLWKEVWMNWSISAVRSVEWHPTSMTDFTGYCFIASVAITGIVLKCSTRRTSATEFLLIVVFMFAAFRSLRMVMWWGIVSAPILVVHFKSIHLIEHRIMAKATKQEKAGESSFINMAIMVVMLIVLLVNLPWSRSILGRTATTGLVNPNKEPVAIASYLRQQPTHGNMINNANWGSYLIWRLWPDYKVFMDTRLHIIPQQIFNDYLDIMNGHADWEKLLNRYDISLAVLSKSDNKRLIECMSENAEWQEIYDDPIGIIYRRQQVLKSELSH